MNSDLKLLQALCGAFIPDNPIQPWWHAEFFRANVLELCSRIIPGENIQCSSSDSLFADPEKKQVAPLEYVPVFEGSRLPAGRPLGKDKVTHHFIFRPAVMSQLFSLACLPPDTFDDALLLSMWGNLTCSLREMLQAKHGDTMIHVPLSSLMARGVDVSVISAVMQTCMAVCEGDKIEGKERILYSDLWSISTLVGWKLGEAAVKAANTSIGRPIVDLAPIAGLIKLGVPKPR
jgi:hypothetical protein